MKYTIFNYRHALEIIQSPRYVSAFDEIADAIDKAPVFRYPYKSKSKSFDVIQQVLNTYFDRRFAVDFGWKFHPPATSIPRSRLKADFQKTFSTPPNELSIQVEAQFGNMARWYTDIFKFQAAYSAGMIQMGVSILPMGSFAKRIDSNIAHYERCAKELPAAKLSITHPVLLIGIEPDATTPVYDMTTCAFPSLKEIKDAGSADNQYRIVNAYLAGLPSSSVSVTSPTGTKAK